MAEIPLASLLGDLNPAECKLHCANWNGTEHPIDVIARSWEEWVAWNRWRGPRNDFNRQFIFSLAQSHDNNAHWLFGGVFEVVKRRNAPRTYSHDVELREDCLPGCIKRLRVGFRPYGRGRRLNMETYLDQIEVIEILQSPYAGEAFPGHDRIDHTLAQLEVIYDQQRPDWRGALEYMKGVYVIHDKVTGKPYVGSAYGDTGIWARWGQYVNSLHGGNAALRELIGRKGDAYARENLSFALLAYWTMVTADEHVFESEAYWKRVLLSREFGNNRN